MEEQRTASVIEKGDEDIKNNFANGLIEKKWAKDLNG